ncbi:MAG: DUF2797 domain-containing protein [Candidatus Aenigmarchaeota archaeon]|nr:DUF2797 domain-containing protein [Candidatus Aenigmarchaeota archaeon]
MMQIMKYSWREGESGYEPFFIMSDGSKMKLFGAALSIRVGGKICTGYTENGKRHECNSRIEYGYMCNECRMKDDFFNCIQCTGTECINPRQRDSCKENNYFIYLASFDSILKVGISFERRLIERLVEQGADFGAKIARVRDGKDVRRVEQDIRRHLGIADRVASKDKARNLFCNPNTCIERITLSIGKLRNSGFNKYLMPPEIYDMRNYYRLERIISEPSMMEAEEGAVIEGSVAAAKGGILIFRNATGLHSVNAHRLIGRQVIIGVASENPL